MNDCSILWVVVLDIQRYKNMQFSANISSTDTIGDFCDKKKYRKNHTAHTYNILVIEVCIGWIQPDDISHTHRTGGSYPDCRKPNPLNAGFHEKYRIAEINYI